MKLRPVERESVCLFGNSVVKVKIRISTVRQRKRRKRCWHRKNNLSISNKVLIQPFSELINSPKLQPSLFAL